MRDFHPGLQISSIEFSASSAFPGQKVDFGPFSVICGSHGAGKSSLLGYIAECLYRDSLHSDYPPFYGEGTGFQKSRPSLRGQCHVTLKLNEQPIRYTVDFDQSSPRGTTPEVMEAHGAVYPKILNPHLLSTDIQVFFQDFSIDMLKDKEVAGPPEMQKKPDLDALRAILGVTYDEVIYTPIVMHGFPEYLYVKARRGTEWVDSHSMSHGELCVHSIRWAIKKASGSIVLLDEPESSIAPRGHAAMLDEIARLARTSGVQVAIATHSAAFLSRIPLSWVRMCVRGDHAPEVMVPSRASDLRYTLGIENPLRLLAIVEDDVAKEVLKLILTSHSFPFMSETDIVPAGSWSDVLIAAKTLSKADRVASVAILDGDQSGKASRGESIFSLPGGDAPERVFLKHAAARPVEMAHKLGCSVASMNVYLAELLGLEHHRWLTALSLRTGQDWRYVLRAAFDIWHRESTHQDDCESLTRGIEAAALSAT